MSYILEALRKADQERSAGSVPDLEAVHESSIRTAGSSRWVWILGAVLALNGLLLAVLLLRDGDSEEEAVVEAGQPAVKTTVSDMPVSPPPVVISQPAPRAPPPAVMAKQPAPVPAPVAAPAPAPPAPAVSTAPTVVRQPVAPTPAHEAEPEASRGAALPPAVVPQDGVPYWDDMSLEFRSGLDMPRLDVHVYDSDPQRRFLLVELKKYREGDTLANGAVIEEILPEGIRLSYRGSRFVYRK
jgi:general secretion pathway protein B